MNGISCVGIFHTHCDRIGTLSPGTQIQTDLKSRKVTAGDLAVVNVCFQFDFFTRVQICDKQFGVELTVGRRKTGVFNVNRKDGCIISKGMKIKTGFFHNIAVSQMSADIVISGTAGKYIIGGISGVLPFVEHSSIMLRIQVRDMHLGKIFNRIVQIIVDIVYGNFAAVRYILA